MQRASSLFPVSPSIACVYQEQRMKGSKEGPTDTFMGRQQKCPDLSMHSAEQGPFKVRDIHSRRLNTDLRKQRGFKSFMALFMKHVYNVRASDRDKMLSFFMVVNGILSPDIILPLSGKLCAAECRKIPYQQPGMPTISGSWRGDGVGLETGDKGGRTLPGYDALQA